MHRISVFFDKLFIIVFKLSIIFVILMVGYISFILLQNSQKEPVSVRIVVTDKFQEDNGFTLFSKGIVTKENANKIRVEFIDSNSLDKNSFDISQYEYDKIEVGKTYWAKFKNNKLGYINFDAPAKK